MGYRPNQQPPSPWREQYGLRQGTPPRPPLVPEMWDSTREAAVVHTKGMVAAAASSAGAFALSAAFHIEWLAIVGLMSVLMMYGIVGKTHIERHDRRKAAAAKAADPTGFMGYADAAPSIEDDLKATRRKIATPCKCGSEEPSVPVDVVFDSAHTITVDSLCPDCREPRTEKQLRFEAERYRRLERAVDLAIQAVQSPDDTGVRSYEQDAAVAVYRQAVAAYEVGLAEVDITYDDRRTVHISQAQVDRIETLASTVMEAKRAVERAAPAPAPWQAMSAAPATGTIIEQGEWVYEIPWHAEDDLCAEDDHEWENLMTHMGTTPVLTLCVTCGARRWPTRTGTPLDQNARPDLAIGELWCPGCSGRGERFGYGCDPCGGTGKYRP